MTLVADQFLTQISDDLVSLLKQAADSLMGRLTLLELIDLIGQSICLGPVLFLLAGLRAFITAEKHQRITSTGSICKAKALKLLF